MRGDPPTTAEDNERSMDDRAWRNLCSRPAAESLGRESRMESEADAFARLAHDLYDQMNFEKTVEKIVESAVTVVGCDYAGLLMTRKGNQFVAINASDPVAEKADKLQVELHEGPGIVAVSEARMTVVHDTATDLRWPRWAAGMRDLRLGSVLAIRLWTSRSTLGALNLYAGSPGRFDQDALAVAEVLGRHASIALSSARQEESLWQAIDARTLIGRAQGILMERFALDDEGAFEVLRRHSQNTNTKLNEVARILISSRTLPKY
jgi:GAF domain-containing protein